MLDKKYTCAECGAVKNAQPTKEYRRMFNSNTWTPRCTQCVRKPVDDAWLLPSEIVRIKQNLES